MNKKPKHPTNFLFGNSLKAQKETKQLTQGKVLCEGCLGELAARLDELYKFKYLLEKANKKLRNQKLELKTFRLRWIELREVLRVRAMPDIGKETNIKEHFAKYRDDKGK